MSVLVVILSAAQHLKIYLHVREILHYAALHLK